MINAISKINLIIVFALCALFVALCAPQFTVHANSAQSSWRGRDSFGAYVTDENCPVVVDSEKLTLRVPDFPNNYYDKVEDAQAYDANVTAEYTFRNPADYDVEMTLVFPFGTMPDYLYDFYDYESGEYVTYDDTAKYSITADGKEIERTLRYTYYSYYFSPDEDLPKLSDNKRQKGIYATQTPVTVYTYEYKVGKSSPDYAHVAASFKGVADGQKTRVLLQFLNSQQDSLYGFSSEKEGSFKMYVIGEPLTKMPQWKIYNDGGLKKVVDGQVNLLPEIETITFEELALTYHEEESIVSEVDWYNAVLDKLTEYENGFVYFGGITSLDVSNRLMRWYEYKLNIPAGGSVVNGVTAPLYPAINGGWNPAKYEYTYLLSPASTWAAFDNFEVEIQTPYNLLSCTLNFEKVEGGYRCSQKGLPEGELTFTLSEAENPERVKNPYYAFGIAMIVLIALCVIAPIVWVVGFIIVLICLLVSRKKNKMK